MISYELTVKVEISKDFGKYQEIEKNILDASRLAASSLMKQIFTDYEHRWISNHAVQKKDRRPKSYKTLLGEIILERWRVWDVFLKQYIYPIDRWMGLSGRQRVSVNLMEEMVNQAVHLPYGKAFSQVQKLSGIRGSSSSLWCWIQAESKKRQEQFSFNKNTVYAGVPLPVLNPGFSDPCPILGVDPDATYVRPRKKADKKHELKMAVLYQGRAEQGKKTKRWALSQKQVVMTLVDESADVLFSRVTHKAINEYGLHGKSRVIVHGDGDPWIRQFEENYCPQALYRLDPYHVFKKIRDATGAEEIPEDWYEDFYTNPSSLQDKIANLKQELADEEDRKKIEALLTYLKNNEEGMRPSGVSKEIKEKYPRMYRRGSGTIESNIFQNICQRFKGPRMMWSKQGLSNLCFLREKELNKNYDFKKVKLEKNMFRENTFKEEMKESIREYLC